MKNNEKNTIVFKVVKDVVYIGIRVGLVVVEWRVLGKVNSLPLKYIERFIAGAIIGGSVGDNVIKALERTNRLINRVKDYRKGRIEEDREKMNEMLNNMTFDWNDYLDKTLDEVAKDFQKYNVEIKEA